MEERDPIAALRACIAAVQREKVQLRDTGHEGSTNIDKLEQCLRQVENILRDKDRVIETLRESLEQVRERIYEEKSCEAQRTDHHHESVAMDVGEGVSCDMYGNTTSGSGPPLGSSDLVKENRTTSGSVSVPPLPSLDCANSTRELEPGHDRLTEPVYETTTPSAEETLPSISSDSVPEEPPVCATSQGIQRTLTTGRHLGWSDN